MIWLLAKRRLSLDARSTNCIVDSFITLQPRIRRGIGKASRTDRIFFLLMFVCKIMINISNKKNRVEYEYNR